MAQNPITIGADQSALQKAAILPALKIGDLTVRIPIVQGGMGFAISKAGLASAVARAGGLGVISAVALGFGEARMAADYLSVNILALRNEIRSARAQADGGVLGVNVMMALSDYGSYVQASAEEGIDVIFSGAGLPVNLPEFVPAGCNSKLVPIISSHRAATVLCKKWLARYGRVPDGFVLEGPMAGGHLGFRPELLEDSSYRLQKLVPETVAAVQPFEELTQKSIPIIAAGGIFTGADIAEFFDLRAAAVQLGTRFVATDECDASQAFKDAYVNSTAKEVIIINSPVGLPGRAIRSKFTDDIAAGKRRSVRCPYKCLVTCDAEKSSYCIALALLNARAGDFKRGFAFAGANVHRVTDIISVQQLMDTLVQEYHQARDQCPDGAGDPHPQV